MDQKIEKILNDLYALDPSLRSRDGEIRRLVVSLIEAKPSAEINENFMRELRKKIISLPRPETRSTHDFSWWAIRLIPIGAIAILLLVFLPEFIKPAPFSPAPASESEEAITVLSTPDSDFAPPPKPPSVVGGEEKTLSAMKISENIINISSQKPGSVVIVDLVELSNPGFVIVRLGSEAGEILGSSKLIPSGVSGEIEINLSRPMSEGEIFYALLRADNGDESFSEATDVPILDSVSGAPMFMVFTASSSVE